MNFGSLKFNSKILLITAAVFLSVMATCAFYLVHKVYWLEVNTSLGGLMNFVDAKQQGVIRFIGQNEKVAKQLGELAGDAEPAVLRKYFAKIVATDVFNQADHPFKDEISSGKRNIATWRRPPTKVKCTASRSLSRKRERARVRGVENRTSFDVTHRPSSPALPPPAGEGSNPEEKK